MTKKELLKTYGRTVFLRAAEVLREEAAINGYKRAAGCYIAIKIVASYMPGSSLLVAVCWEFFRDNCYPTSEWLTVRSRVEGNFLGSRIARLLHAAELVGEL